jgi:hypothetical protein
MHLAPALWDRSEILPGMATFHRGNNLKQAPMWVRLRQYQKSDREEVRRLCCDTNRTLMLSGFQTVCKMLSRLLTGKYSDHPRSEHFVRWVLARGLKEQPGHPGGAARLHINLERPLRWGSVARRLLAMYEDMLFAAGIDHYYAKFFSCPQRNPQSMYGRCGFQIFDQVETTIFKGEVIDTVSVICTHKKLGVAI